MTWGHPICIDDFDLLTQVCFLGTTDQLTMYLPGGTGTGLRSKYPEDCTPYKVSILAKIQRPDLSIPTA